VYAIRSSFEPLLTFPLSGPERDHLAPGLRVTFHQKYAIYYLVRPDELIIVRVIHGARDIASIAERGELAFPEI